MYGLLYMHYNILSCVQQQIIPTCDAYILIYWWLQQAFIYFFFFTKPRNNNNTDMVWWFNSKPLTQKQLIDTLDDMAMLTEQVFHSHI